MAKLKEVLAAEGGDEPIIFMYKDVELKVASGESLDLDALRAFEDGKVVTFIELALGPDQWAAVRKAGLKTVAELNVLVKAMFAANGSSPGE